MHIDKLIEKLDEEMKNTKSHQRKIELIGKIEELRKKRNNMEKWEVKDVDPSKYL